MQLNPKLNAILPLNNHIVLFYNKLLLLYGDQNERTTALDLVPLSP